MEGHSSGKVEGNLTVISFTTYIGDVILSTSQTWSSIGWLGTVTLAWRTSDGTPQHWSKSWKMSSLTLLSLWVSILAVTCWATWTWKWYMVSRVLLLLEGSSFTLLSILLLVSILPNIRRSHTGTSNN